MKFCRNFANVFRKWKTLWIFAEIDAKFCKNSLQFPKSSRLFIIQFIFSFHSLMEKGFTSVTQDFDVLGSCKPSFRMFSPACRCARSRLSRTSCLKHSDFQRRPFRNILRVSFWWKKFWNRDKQDFSILSKPISKVNISVAECVDMYTKIRAFLHRW